MSIRGIGPEDSRGIPPEIGKKNEQTKANEVIDSLMHVDYKGSYTVKVERPLSSGIVDLFDELPEEINFKDVSETKVEHKYTGMEMGKSFYNPAIKTASCTFVKESKNALFEWSYDPKTEKVGCEEEYIGQLPRWMKIGDSKKWLHPTKGIPTSKVMKVLMYKSLGLSKENVTQAFSCAMNAQTVVDILHAMVIEGKSQEEAFAGSQTVQLLAELGQMLGYKKTIITSVKADYPGAYTFIPTALTYTGWTSEQITAFENQPKIKALQNAGVPILDPAYKVPDALNISVKFSDA